jgi:hypothetical protein
MIPDPDYSSQNLISISNRIPIFDFDFDFDCDFEPDSDSDFDRGLNPPLPSPFPMPQNKIPDRKIRSGISLFYSDAGLSRVRHCPRSRALFVRAGLLTLGSTERPRLPGQSQWRSSSRRPRLQRRARPRFTRGSLLGSICEHPDNTL